jgi:hypothetical protein
VKAEPT